MDLMRSLDRADATHGRLYFADCTVFIEIQSFYLSRAVLVKVRREGIMMIEEIPLSLIFDDTVMVGPASVLMLGHNDSLIFIWSHRILAHSIAENLGIFPYIRIGKIVIPVIFKCERTFSLTVRQILQAIYTDHFKLVRSPLDHLTRIIVSEFLHIVLKLGTASVSPENIGISVRCKKHTRINTVDALDRLRLTHKRALRTVCHSYSNCKSTGLGCIREIEIIFSVLLHTIWRPHRICIRLTPRHIFLLHYDSMICPGSKII